MTRREWLSYGLFALLVAAAVHLGTVFATPRFVMDRAFARIGSHNVMHFGKRPDETARGVVRPSPDLLYSLCVFDLTRGSVRVTAPVPKGTYWSISLYDDETNNFYVRNDRQLKGRADIVIAYDTAGVENDEDRPPELVTSPTRKGVVLIRTLVNSESDFARLDRVRRQATCSSTLPDASSSGG